MTFLVTTILALVGYLVLTAGSGTVLGLWSVPELVAGAVAAVLVGWAASRVLFHVDQKTMLKIASPVRWFTWLVYFGGPFLYALWLANLDVAGRVITGRINPGIVRIKSGIDRKSVV